MSLNSQKMARLSDNLRQRDAGKKRLPLCKHGSNLVLLDSPEAEEASNLFRLYAPETACVSAAMTSANNIYCLTGVFL